MLANFQVINEKFHEPSISNFLADDSGILQEFQPVEFLLEEQTTKIKVDIMYELINDSKEVKKEITTLHKKIINQKVVRLSTMMIRQFNTN